MARCQVLHELGFGPTDILITIIMAASWMNSIRVCLVSGFLPPRWRFSIGCPFKMLPNKGYPQKGRQTHMLFVRESCAIRRSDLRH